MRGYKYKKSKQVQKTYVGTDIETSREKEASEAQIHKSINIEDTSRMNKAQITEKL